MRTPTILFLIAVCALATSCESWLGPAEGDGIRATHVSGNGATIVVEGGTCGGVVRFDGGPPVSFHNEKVFRDLDPGTYTVNSKGCWGDGGGGVWGGGGTCTCSEWSYCTVTVGRGDRVVLEAGWCN